MKITLTILALLGCIVRTFNFTKIKLFSNKMYIQNYFLKIKSMLNATATVPSACLSAYMASALNQTNFYRARHGVGALTEDSTIRTTSQAWANYLSDNNLFQHNTAKLQSLGYGENIAYNYASGSPSSLTAAACASI